MDFLYKRSQRHGDYDDVSVIVDRLDKLAHFLFVQRDYILDHLVKFLIPKFIKLSSVLVNFYSNHDSIFTSMY